MKVIVQSPVAQVLAQNSRPDEGTEGQERQGDRPRRRGRNDE